MEKDWSPANLTHLISAAILYQTSITFLPRTHSLSLSLSLSHPPLQISMAL